LNSMTGGESGQTLGWLIVFLLCALWCKDSSQSWEAEGGEKGRGRDVTQLFGAGMMVISSITWVENPW
jgi:hypothetical protein